jgi:hypothetical protein
MDQFAKTTLKGVDKETYNLNYYHTSDDQQAKEEKKLPIQFTKDLIARLDIFEHASSKSELNKPVPTSIGACNRLMAKDITVLEFQSDLDVCSIPEANQEDIAAYVVVPLQYLGSLD